MALRVKLLRDHLHMPPDKSRVKLDAWNAKTLCSFVKMKTSKRLASRAPWRYSFLGGFLQVSLSIIPTIFTGGVHVCVLQESF